MPHPLDLRLSDEAAEGLQAILEEMSGHAWTLDDAKQRGLELLRLAYLLMDPAEYARRIKDPVILDTGVKMQPVVPSRPPQAFPIPLQGNHLRDLELKLQQVAHELASVKRRPTSWRWALVCMYDALGHALALHRPETYWPKEDLGQLTALFDAIAAERPELPQVQESIALIDRVRTTYVADGVTRWPVSLKMLPAVFEDCLRVIRRLVPEAGVGCDAVQRIFEDS